MKLYRKKFINLKGVGEYIGPWKRMRWLAADAGMGWLERSESHQMEIEERVVGVMGWLRGAGTSSDAREDV